MACPQLVGLGIACFGWLGHIVDGVTPCSGNECYVAGPRGVCRVLVACRGATALPSRVCPVQNTRVHAFHTDGSGDRVELARLAWPPYVMHTGMRVRIGLIGLS